MPELRAWIKELGFPAAIAAYLLYLVNVSMTRLTAAVEAQNTATAALVVQIHDLRESLDYARPPATPAPPAPRPRAWVFGDRHAPAAGASTKHRHSAIRPPPPVFSPATARPRMVPEGRIRARGRATSRSREWSCKV